MDLLSFIMLVSIVVFAGVVVGIAIANCLGFGP